MFSPFGILAQIVGILFLVWLFFRWSSKKQDRADMIAGWKEIGLVVRCPALLNPESEVEKLRRGGVLRLSDLTKCLNDMLANGTYKGAAGLLGRKGHKFECSKCGKETTFDMDRNPPEVVAGRQPRRRRRAK